MMWGWIQLPIAESATSQLNLALDIVLRVSVSRKQTEFSAQVRDNVSNVLLACVHLPVCANLATCILDVKDGYCGICYQSLIPAALEKSSEDFTEFYKHQEEDFERVETVHVYTTPHRIPGAELTPEAPAVLTASQEINPTFAQKEATPLEEAVNEGTVFHSQLANSASEWSQDQTQLESHVSERSSGVPAVSDTLHEESIISHQPQASSVVSNNPPSLADTAYTPSHAKFTFKNVLRQFAPGKPAASSASQKAQVHPAPQSPSSMVRSVPPHPKAAPTSSRLVPSTSEAAPTIARGASNPEHVPSFSQAPEPVVPALALPAPRATPTPVKASTPSQKAELAPQKATASSGKASAAPDKARSKKADPSAEKAAVKPAAKLKLAASISDTLPRPTSPVLGLVDPGVSVSSTASGSHTPLPSAVVRASTVRSERVPSRPINPPPMPKAALPLTSMGPSEPLEAPSATAEVPPLAQTVSPGVAADTSLPIESPFVPAEAHAKQGPAPSEPLKTPSTPGDPPSQAKAAPASQTAAPQVDVGNPPEAMQGTKAAPTAQLEVPSMPEAAPSASALSPSMQKAHPVVPEATAAASVATPAVKSEDPMGWTQDLGRVLVRLSPSDSSKAIKLPSDFGSLGFSVNGGLRLQKSHNRVISQSGIAQLKNKKGPQVAFEAFSVLDGFGRPSAPLQASKTLVPTILAALDGSKPIARARKGASDGQLGFALQVAFTEALPTALLEGYSATDAVLREQVKGEGSMATVAFVCGRQLVVATAGTSCAYLDTGAHIYPMSRRRRAEGPTPGLAPPSVMQANIPQGGARLILASGPFWDIVTPAQDINNVRKCAARDAPVKLQAGAVKQGLKVDPTLLVVDLAPPTSPAGLIDLQKLCKQKQAQVAQVWQPLHPSSPTNTHPEWRCQPATQLVDSTPLDSKLHQPAAVTHQQGQEVEQPAVPETVQHQQASLQYQTISAEQVGKQQQQQQQQVKDQRGPEKVVEKVQTGKQQPKKLPQQAADKQQVIKQQAKKATQQVTDIKLLVQQQPENLPEQVPEVVQPTKQVSPMQRTGKQQPEKLPEQVISQQQPEKLPRQVPGEQPSGRPTNQASAKQHAGKQLPKKLSEQVAGQQLPKQATQEVSEQQQQPKVLPAEAPAASQAGKHVSQKLPKPVTAQQSPQKSTKKASEQHQTHKQQSQKLLEETQPQQQQPQKKSEAADKQQIESQQQVKQQLPEKPVKKQAHQPAEQDVKKPQAVQQAAQQVAKSDAQSATTSQSGLEVGPAIMPSPPAMMTSPSARMTSPPALSKSAKRRIAQQNTARDRATFGCAVLEQEQLLERGPRDKARRERKQQAELQHEEDVKAAEGQHEKMMHAKASASNPQLEAQGEGEAVATKVVKAEGPNPDSTPVPPQSPQAKSSATLHHSQERQSAIRGGSKGKGGGHGVTHDGSQGRGHAKHLQPSSAAGVIRGPSGPPQQQPKPSGRGRSGGRGSSRDQSRGRGRGRGGHSAHPTQQPFTQNYICPPPGLAPVRNTVTREHDSTPTHRVSAARAAAAWATRPSKVIYVPVHFQRDQSHCHSTPAPPQSPQAKSSATFHHSQEPQSGSRGGTGGGHDVTHAGSQGRGDTRDRQPSSAAGVIGGPSGPPQQQPHPSGRGRAGGRGSTGAQSRGRGRGRGGPSAHPTQQPLIQSHVPQPSGLGPVRDTTVKEHDSTPTRRVNAARAAAARATCPSKVIYVPVHYQRDQSHCHSGAQAQGSQAPGHPIRGHGGARGHMGRRAGHGNGPSATSDAASTTHGSSRPNQAVSHQQAHTEEARQQQLPQQTQQQRQHSGGNRRDQRDNQRHNAVKQWRDGGDADSFHRQVPTASSQQATDKYVGQQGQRAPARITSVDTGHLSQSQGDSGKPHRGNKQRGQQGQCAPARTTSDDTGHLSQLQSGNGNATPDNSTHQTASRNMHDHTQASDGFRPQHGTGGVNRAPPGLQRGINRAPPGLQQEVNRAPPRLQHRVNRAPPGLQQGVNNHAWTRTPETPWGLQQRATGQQQGSVGAGLKLLPGLPMGANSSAARQHDDFNAAEPTRGAQPSSQVVRTRSDVVRPEGRVGSNHNTNRISDGRVLEVACQVQH